MHRHTLHVHPSHWMVKTRVNGKRIWYCSCAVHQAMHFYNFHVRSRND